MVVAIWSPHDLKSDQTDHRLLRYLAMKPYEQLVDKVDRCMQTEHSS